MPGTGIGGGTRVATMSQTQSSRPGRGAPAASTATRGVILVVGAVIIGVMLLWKGGGADTASGKGEDVLQPDTGSSATAGKGSTTTAAPPVTAVPPAQLAVAVANASGVTGLAKTKAEELKAKGYANATFVSATAQTPLSQVFFVAGSEGDAKAVAAAMGFPPARVAPIPDPPPIANLKNNTVVVVIGLDKGDTTVAAPGVSTTAKP